MGMLRIIDPGVFTTVQDSGRDGWMSIGVAPAGAIDPISLHLANLLVDNDPAVAALELTFRGGVLEFEHDGTAALVGATMPVDVVSRDGAERTLSMARSFSLRAGDRLRIGQASTGARTYLAVRGGIRVDSVLGSASTHPASALGGYRGRSLRAEDRLEFADASGAPTPSTASSRALTAEAEALVASIVSRRSLRATLGSHTTRFERGALETFWKSTYTVTSRVDRMGLRIAGPRLESPDGGRMPSEGMPLGAVQVTPEGEPIILLNDRPTTGGYPVIACVASVDAPTLGQLRPGDAVRFEPIDFENARLRFAEQHRRLCGPWAKETLVGA